MSTLPLPRRVVGNGYPTTDHKPMAETDYHRDLMLDLIETLRAFYVEEPLVYVSGNLLLFYEEGDKRKHVSPDVFVVRGVGMHQRPNFLLWEEGHPPRFVIELTSSSTRKADIGKKFELYRDVLKVREYFLFDPNGDYLKPPMQGWRLVKGVYKSIRPVEGRLPSETTGLHLERDGKILRLWNPETKTWLPTPMERVEEAERSRDDAQRARDDAQRSRDDAERARDDAQRSRDDVQRSRDDAERSRDDAERARDDAQQARDDAQQARDDAQQARDDAQRRLAAALEELRQLKKIPPVAPGAAP